MIQYLNNVIRKNKEKVQKLYLDGSPYWDRGYFSRMDKVWWKNLIKERKMQYTNKFVILKKY